MSSSNSEIIKEVLFTLQNTQHSARTQRTPKNPTLLPSNDFEEESDQPISVILCVLWKNGKLGAAYFKSDDQQLYVLQEMLDIPPSFLITRSLCREINPTHTITIGTTCDPFVKCIVEILNTTEDEEKDSNGSESVNTRLLRSNNITLLHFKEYSLSNCEFKVYNLNLPSEPENATNTQREVFLHSLIDFDCKISVHSLGALVKFMEQNWSYINPNEKELKFLQINQVSLHKSVLIDRNTFNGLQILNKDHQNYYFKNCGELRGSQKNTISNLLSQHCKSKLGYLCLRTLLKNPTNDITELNKRLDFIQFALLPTNQGFIDALREHMKKISDVNVILRKIQYAVANNADWETLYKTICNTIFLNEVCEPYHGKSSLLGSLNIEITPKLYELQHCIHNALDFTQCNKDNRPTIKFGLDSELDAKELKKQDITKNATAAAQIAINTLPEYLKECSVVYIPEMGHFVAVMKWEINCDWNALETYGFSFVFETNSCLHYKNSICYELDKQLGNIYLDIIVHQNRIIQRLSGLILRYNKDIREPLKIIGLIDCLLSISRVAKEKDYVRPNLNEDSIHEIEDGRHPVSEILHSSFVSNHFYSGGKFSRMKILTGPNNSGKTIYLKQIALIIYLAHVGCYVPAKKANIGIVHSIHSRIYCAESAGVNLSAFMIDLSQIAQALHNAKKSSLVIIDEFGRGTLEDDGRGLLIGAIKKFSNEKESCPHVLVSTHFQEICQYLPKSNILSYVKMDFEKGDAGEIIYLYKVVNGISKSFAFDVGLASGIDRSIINRAKELYNMLSGRTDSTVVNNNLNVPEVNLFDLNIPEPDD